MLKDGEKMTKKNTEIGMKLRLTEKFNKNSAWYNYLKQARYFNKIAYVQVTSFHSDSHHDVLNCDYYDNDHNKLGSTSNDGVSYLSAGYQGEYDLEYYDPITYNIEDILSGLDKIADKI